ncbi:hypothetical protein MSAN_00730800 [Mycena sanguinolenta]|uniref:Uncharacterized protein n=1 Tax=Mycena sanguinolenta TaxID=230812 RepID=A0A8H6Z537_9AGAR|nr:hypothetical protein MSAN_00730800 [Mycena sanguinolenta]
MKARVREEWRPELLVQLVEILKTVFEPPPPSSLFAERFKYAVISSSLLSTTLPVPHTPHSSHPHRPPSSPTPSFPGKLSIDVPAPPPTPPPPLHLVDFRVLALLGAFAFAFLAMGLYFFHYCVSRPDMSSATMEALSELITANAQWDAVVQETVSLLEKEEESPPSPVSAIRLSLHSSLHTTQTQCDNVRHLLAALTAPVEAAQLAEMYAPPSPRHSLILSTPASPGRGVERSRSRDRDKRSTWAGAPPGLKGYKTRDRRRSDLSSILPFGPAVTELKSTHSHSAPSTPLGELREEGGDADMNSELGLAGQHFGAAALELHRRRRISGVETLGLRLHPQAHSHINPHTPPRTPLSGASTISHSGSHTLSHSHSYTSLSHVAASHASGASGSRFTTMHAVRHPLALSALYHALDGARAAKRYACSHLLALRFDDPDPDTEHAHGDEGYWGDVRSVMALLTSTFADAAARLGDALVEAEREEAELAQPEPVTAPGLEFPSSRERTISGSMLGALGGSGNGFAPVPTHLTRFAAHVDAISSALDDAREHLAECVAALRERSPAPEQQYQPHLRRRRSRTFSLSRLTGGGANPAVGTVEPAPEPLALQAYERLRRGTRARAEGESEEDYSGGSVPSLASDECDETSEEAPPPPVDVPIDADERQRDAVVVAVPEHGAEVDDDEMIPLPGAEQVFESTAEVGVFSRERSKLTREERIKLAKERRANGARMSVGNTTVDEDECRSKRLNGGPKDKCSKRPNAMNSFGNTTPFASNPFETKEDLARFLIELLDPLAAHTSPGGARIHLGHTATHYDEAAAQLEGFSRPVWGLGSLLAGGGTYAGAQRWVHGLANGCDPNHEEFWGDMRDRDQRMVECSALGFALSVAREQLWDPLSEEAKANVERWLGGMNDKQMPNTNWLWFRVFANLGLSKVGSKKFDAERMKKDMDHLDTFYIGDGWSRDGPEGVVQLDYYSSSFAIQFAQLVYSKLAAADDPVRCEEYRNRARQFALDFVHYFDAEASHTASPCPHSGGALAFANVELPAPLTWGVVKGLQLRNIRYWAAQPGAYYPDGTFTIGFCYPNHNMTENYNSPGSPYWACKSFVALALPDTHPFWTAPEEPYPLALMDTVKVLKHPLHIATNVGGHTYLLSSGQQCSYPVKQGAAKYGKLAYSSAFGYSVPVGSGTLEELGGDSTLALSDDGGETWKDVSVETWLVPPTPEAPLWHLRVHRLRTARALTSAEGGFAIYGQGTDGRALAPLPANAHAEVFGTLADGRSARAASRAGVSGIVDLSPRLERKGTPLRTDANSNLVVARAVLPTLMGEHERSFPDIWLVTAVFALPSMGAHEGAIAGWEAGWSKRPIVPAEIAAFM